MSNEFDAMFGENSAVEEAPVVEAVPVVEEAPVVEQAPVQNAPVPVQTTQEISKGVSDSFEIGIPEELMESLSEVGVKTLDIGEKISKIPIEKYKASSSKVDRIAFLTKKTLAVKYHFIDGVGSITCFGGKCCEVGGTPSIRYIFPIAVYTTDADGNVSGSKVELKILSAGEDLYKNIMTINKGAAQLGGIDHIDLLVTCTDDKYQKISLTNTGSAIWRQYKEVAKFLNDRWAKDGANAYMAVARKCDEQTFMKLTGLDEAEGNIPPAQFDAATNSDLSKFFDE